MILELTLELFASAFEEFQVGRFPLDIDDLERLLCVSTASRGDGTIERTYPLPPLHVSVCCCTVDS